MKGSYRIIIRNFAVRYDFEIKRNITILQGNSASGKTTLVEMIREFYENGEASGIEMKCEKICMVLQGRDWNLLLQNMYDRIIFIDQGNDFVFTKEFSRAIQKSNNYYVIVTREALVNLPYSVEEIYGIRKSGKYASLKATYNEFYHIYGKKDYFGKIVVESASGKSNIFGKIIRTKGEDKILVIADGAAFGPEMERVVKLIKSKGNLVLYLPESFEWLILKANILGDKEINTILSEPQKYIESSEYFSWERYFTDLLVLKTEDNYLKYSKKKINQAYLQNSVKQKICEQMSGIKLL